MSQLERRSLLFGLGALGLITGCEGPRGWRGGAQGKGAAPPLDSGDTGLGAEWADTAVEPVTTCEVTGAFAEGPFYQSGAPARVDLRTAGEVGTTLVLDFVVRGGRDCRLLSDAVVDLWHVMQTGLYDLEGTEMHYRCKVQTGFDGRVQITTLKPISYYTETGKLMPAHFHIKVSAAGHDTVTTQLRFANDPDDDGQVPAELLLTPSTASDGSQQADFVFTLKPA